MKKLLIPTIIFLISFVLLVFSGANVILWEIDNKDIESKVNLVQNMTPINVITVTDETTKEEENYLTADFTKIKELNSDTIAWLNVPETKINYPVLQSKDNSYYLNHSFDKKKNKAGWVFMDYRNNSSITDSNTVIYGHNRLDGSMFSSLNNLTKKDYLNKEEHLIYLSTPEYNYVYEIFSIYRIDSTDDYIKSNFLSDEFNHWLELVKNRSIYNFHIDVTNTDKVLTLTTCYKNVKKTVVHAKLIRKQTREIK